ncbi:trypsin-like peptidase domain-containing protein [Agrobacterium rhizogenes]|uniref:trypsin-like serine peptidase n=1 Tax=Rhizobium rhizogenes TaxID=359 RepID=UPI001571D6FD|nr:trypsin-like peptidase domain-containing protein [Rhizobium rhizogenes]NTI01890.1 trypsin-like peptidase domain-containing protein [Rhizobium rhizogenes]NTI08693.1 trypsin-like peptidase domain-containing protein [Rhizobium rhizogenes]
MASITQQSVQSLFVEMFFNETRLSSGTGFMAIAPSVPVLITNRHNVTGRRQDNDQPMSPTGGVPNKIRIWRNLKGKLGRWNSFDYPLYDENDHPKWIEHPTLGATADFVAVKLDERFDIEIYPYDTTEPKMALSIKPAEIVSVIGFPFGQSAGGLFPIWVSGFIASEIEIDYDNKPQFLIDCRTRPGQSGSPVVAVRYGVAQLRDGDTTVGSDHAEFLGIYGGRINENSDIGIVWKRQAVDQLIRSIF